MSYRYNCDKNYPELQQEVINMFHKKKKGRTSRFGAEGKNYWELTIFNF